MKKVALAISVVLVAVLFSSCARKSPEEVVKKYYTYFCKGEYDKVLNYVMHEHRFRYSLLMDQLIVPIEERKALAKRKIKISNITCVTFENTEAICSCTIYIDNKESQSEELKLKKVDGTWLVDLGKENAMETMEEENRVIGSDDDDMSL